MKTYRSFVVLALFSLALLSCDSEVSVEDPKLETEQVETKTGSQGNDEVERED